MKFLSVLFLVALLLSGCITASNRRDPVFRNGDIVYDVLNPYQPGVVVYGFRDPLAGHWRYLVRFIPASEATGWAREALIWVDSFELVPSSSKQPCA